MAPLGEETSMTRPKTYRIGSAEVTRIPELQLDGFTPAALLPGWTDDDDAPARRRPGSLTPESFTPDGRRVLLSVHSWLIRDRGRTILVDTGAGNDKDRPHARYFDRLRTPYLDRLAAAGVTPEAVDYVLLSHLHVDHVGWNTRLTDGAWVPTFPNARYVFSRREYEFFSDPANRSERNRTSAQAQEDSVDPVIAAGLADTIEVDGQEVIPGLSFHPTPGHSPDHASIVLQSDGEQAIFAGDVLHHPIQVERPDLVSIFDADLEATLRSRHWVLSYAADADATFFASHFPSTAAGRVERDGDGFAWHFE